MEPIKAVFDVVKVDDETWDVVILAEDAVLKSFVKVYDRLFYVPESVFDRKPAVIAPDFPNHLHATAWKDYWILAFNDPDNACHDCPTVNQLLGFIEQSRKNARNE
jgi:hypothetical protein